MCCFSGRVQSVTNTSIFARSAASDRQILVYEMKLATSEDVAMILPLPVPPKSPEDALRFISLKDYSDFFADMSNGFPPPPSEEPRDRGPVYKPAAAPLAVVEVGDFEASFVPSIRDFSRLDARFRLPDSSWEKLPAYGDWGFAVFKLKKGVKKIHPMAFEFPRRDGRRLFFPTVHIHDGEVHEKAAFDHTLYCQKQTGDAFATLHWAESPLVASQFMHGKDAGVTLGERHVFRLEIRGERENEDVILAA